MYKIAEYIGDDAKRFASSEQPLGMGLREGLTKRVYAILVYGSSFSDPGPDKTTMVAFDSDNIKLATVTVDGY
tara:strand:- start:522 stop:740 length:219 start_codon:yes stop_codon:yes gene_type:complete